MNADEALSMARAAGVEISIEGSDLVLAAERPPSSAVLQTLARHKAAIVHHLASQARDTPGRDTPGRSWAALYADRVRRAQTEGGQSPDRARRAAFDACVAAWLTAHPETSPPDRCLMCGAPDQDVVLGGRLLAFGMEPAGHAWLHARCWPGWHARRTARAVAALGEQGLRDPGVVP